MKVCCRPLFVLSIYYTTVDFAKSSMEHYMFIGKHLFVQIFLFLYVSF
jgi:hypothetical protein